MLEQGQFAAAATLIRKSGQQRCDYRADLLLAAALDGSSNLPGAKQTLERGHREWPSNCSIAASLSRYDLQAGDAADAERAVRGCVPTERTSQRELRLIALVYLDNGELARARQIADIAYRREPGEENLLFLANVLQLQGRYEDVVTLLGRQRRSYGDSAGFLITIGESESDAKMYPAAERDLRHALVLQPASYAAHYVLGNLLVATGRFAAGIAQFKAAIQLNPQQPRTYYQIGRALEEQNQGAEARRYFEQSLAVDAHYAPAWCEIGKLELRANHVASAVDHLNRAIQYNPSLQDSYYLLVQAYARLGEREKSRQVMAQWNAWRKAHPMRPAGLDQDSVVTGAQARSSAAASSK